MNHKRVPGKTVTDGRLSSAPLQAGETNIEQQHTIQTSQVSATNGKHLNGTKSKTASSYEQEHFEQINSQYVEQTHTEQHVSGSLDAMQLESRH